MLKKIGRRIRKVGNRAAWDQKRLDLLRFIGNCLVPGYRFQWPQMEWWHDEKFNDYLKQFNEIRGFNIGRRWTLWQLARLVAAVPGDTAECGVFQGSSTYLICHSTGGRLENPRTHHVFDSFEGLSEPTNADGDYWSRGTFACDLDTVKANLASLRNLSWHKGWIPDRFKDVEDRKFAFVHIDVDLYEPTRDSVEFFYPRMSKGGIIVCDDYGCTTCPGATRAIDEFLREMPEKAISLACGGGFLIRDCPTAELVQPDYVGSHRD